MPKGITEDLPTPRTPSSFGFSLQHAARPDQKELTLLDRVISAASRAIVFLSQPKVAMTLGLVTFGIGCLFRSQALVIVGLTFFFTGISFFSDNQSRIEYANSKRVGIENLGNDWGKCKLVIETKKAVIEQGNKDKQSLLTLIDELTAELNKLKKANLLSIGEGLITSAIQQLETNKDVLNGVAEPTEEDIKLTLQDIQGILTSFIKDFDRRITAS